MNKKDNRTRAAYLYWDLKLKDHEIISERIKEKYDLSFEELRQGLISHMSGFISLLKQQINN